MPPAARITDFHACPMVTPGTPPIPHVGGPIMKGSHNVLTGKLPQARVGDMAVCVGPMDVIVKGSSGVFVNKMPAARIGDQTAHGGTIVAGFPTVIIGETKAGGGGGAALPNTAAVQFAYTEVLQQLQVLIDAWKTAAPFCEACFRKAMPAPARAPTAPASGPAAFSPSAPPSEARVAPPPPAPARASAPMSSSSQPLPVARQTQTASAINAFDMSKLGDQQRVSELTSGLQDKLDDALDATKQGIDLFVDGAIDAVGGILGNLMSGANTAQKTTEVFDVVLVTMEIQRSSSKNYQLLLHYAAEVDYIGMDAAVEQAHGDLVNTNYIKFRGDVFSREEIRDILVYLRKQ